MKYFSIESSLNKKIMGKIPQAKEFIHHCDVWEEPNFIDRFIFEEIKIQPILSNVVLYSNAKKTDLIDTYGDVGFVFSYIISTKLKELFEKFNYYGFQFFNTYVIQNNEKLNDYWVINKYDFPYQYIDLKRTTFKLKNSLSRETLGIIEFSNLDDFLAKIDSIKYPETISISDLSFNENMDLDFFSLRFYENGGHKGIVSERLKNEIEKNEITGIEFRLIEIPFQDWQKRDGQRDQIYGRSW